MLQIEPLCYFLTVSTFSVTPQVTCTMEPPAKRYLNEWRFAGGPIVVLFHQYREITAANWGLATTNQPLHAYWGWDSNFSYAMKDLLRIL